MDSNDHAKGTTVDSNGQAKGTAVDSNDQAKGTAVDSNDQAKVQRWIQTTRLKYSGGFKPPG